jgi:predicted TIM-barrel fold metal-dependent hydrolase
MLPRLISPDDHILEPPDLWTSRLASTWGDAAPRLVRDRGRVELRGGAWRFTEDPDGRLTDCWHYDGDKVAVTLPAAAVGYDLDDMEGRTIVYDEVRPGCYKVPERLEDMDLAGIEASLCFPGSFVRFCGQRFLKATDKDLALACVRAYNDFIVEEWAGSSGGRLIPMSIVPLWDPELAAAEVRHNAARGVPAVAFSEIPPYLGLPSVHSGAWSPFFSACEETETVIMMHIGSSSQLPTTSDDAPAAVQTSAASVNSAMSLLDWLFSGVFETFKDLKVSFAESQIGWIPYFLERADRVWLHNRGWNEVYGKLPEPPSSYFPAHVFCSFFSDDHGLANLDIIGEDNVMFETDYPHSDSNWPTSHAVATEMLQALPEATQVKVARTNAQKLFRLPA